MLLTLIKSLGPCIFPFTQRPFLLTKIFVIFLTNWPSLYDACSTIIHALISCRLDYCNSILYNVPKSKTDRLQRIQIQCAHILTKSPRRGHITPVLIKLHWLKIQDRIIYKMLMLTYKSYYNMAPPYLCELINKKESCEYLGTDHHQLIMPPISKDCSNTFHSFMLLHANGTN